MQFFILPQEGEKSSFFMFFLLVLLLVSCIDTKVDSTPLWATLIRFLILFWVFISFAWFDLSDLACRSRSFCLLPVYNYYYFSMLSDSSLSVFVLLYLPSPLSCHLAPILSFIHLFLTALCDQLPVQSAEGSTGPLPMWHRLALLCPPRVTERSWWNEGKRSGKKLNKKQLCRKKERMKRQKDRSIR